MLIETEGIEFKEKFTEDIYKEVIAFANTGGVYVRQSTSIPENRAYSANTKSS